MKVIKTENSIPFLYIYNSSTVFDMKSISNLSFLLVIKIKSHKFHSMRTDIQAF